MSIFTVILSHFETFFRILSIPLRPLGDDTSMISPDGDLFVAVKAGSLPAPFAEAAAAVVKASVWHQKIILCQMTKRKGHFRSSKAALLIN